MWQPDDYMYDMRFGAHHLQRCASEAGDWQFSDCPCGEDTSGELSFGACHTSTRQAQPLPYQRLAMPGMEHAMEAAFESQTSTPFISWALSANSAMKWVSLNDNSATHRHRKWDFKRVCTDWIWFWQSFVHCHSGQVKPQPIRTTHVTQVGA